MTRTAWSIVVFTSREEPATLRRTIDAVIAASASRVATIDILVDGNARTAAAIARATLTGLAPGSALRLWLAPWRDKASAWNCYVHEIAPIAEVAFFIDGYARPRVDSLLALEKALHAAPEAWAATAVPSVGRSAAALRTRMLAEGGLHGSVYALRASVVARFRQSGFRLPLGLYRNDSLIGAVASFAGDPARQVWDPPRRIAISPGATWDNDVPTIGIASITGHFRRLQRQAQGDLEIAAIRQHLAVRRLPPETLPQTLKALLASAPAPAPRGPLHRILLRRATRVMARDRDWSDSRASPQLLQTWEGTSSTASIRC